LACGWALLSQMCVWVASAVLKQSPLQGTKRIQCCLDTLLRSAQRASRTDLLSVQNRHLVPLKHPTGSATTDSSWCMCVSDAETSNVAKSLELTAVSSELYAQYGVLRRGVSQLCVGRPRRNVVCPVGLEISSNSEMAAISSQTLTDKIDSSESIACDLSNFHILGIYP
jgi:hypothetical protein